MKRMRLVLAVILVVLVLLTACTGYGVKQKIIFNSGASVLCESVMYTATYTICVDGFRSAAYRTSTVERVVFVSMEK